MTRGNTKARENAAPAALPVPSGCRVPAISCWFMGNVNLFARRRGAAESETGAADGGASTDSKLAACATKIRRQAGGPQWQQRLASRIRADPQRARRSLPERSSAGSIDNLTYSAFTFPPVSGFFRRRSTLPVSGSSQAIQTGIPPAVREVWGCNAARWVVQPLYNRSARLTRFLEY